MAEEAAAGTGPTVADGIWYFSPTGTSRTVAEGLQKRFPDVMLHDLTTPAARLVAPVPLEGDLCTLIFPVYANGAPELVLDWLERVPWGTRRWVFIATYGSVNQGQALEECARAVRGKGTVVGAAALPGSHCYDFIPGIPKAVPSWDWAELEDFYRAVREKQEEIRLKAPEFHIPQRWMAWLCAPPPKTKGDCLHCERYRCVCPTGGKGCIRCGACVRLCPTGGKKLIFRTPFPLWYIRRGMAKEKTGFFHK